MLANFGLGCLLGKSAVRSAPASLGHARSFADFDLLEQADGDIHYRYSVEVRNLDHWDSLEPVCNPGLAESRPDLAGRLVVATAGSVLADAVGDDNLVAVVEQILGQSMLCLVGDPSDLGLRKLGVLKAPVDIQFGVADID